MPSDRGLPASNTRPDQSINAADSRINLESKTRQFGTFLNLSGTEEGHVHRQLPPAVKLLIYHYMYMWTLQTKGSDQQTLKQNRILGKTLKRQEKRLGLGGKEKAKQNWHETWWIWTVSFYKHAISRLNGMGWEKNHDSCTVAGAPHGALTGHI